MVNQESMKVKGKDDEQVSSYDINNVDFFFDRILQGKKEDTAKDLKEVENMIKKTANEKRPQLLEDLQTLIESEYKRAMKGPAEVDLGSNKKKANQNKKRQEGYNNLDEGHIDEVKKAYDKAIKEANMKTAQEVKTAEVEEVLEENEEEEKDKTGETETIDATNHIPKDFEEFTESYNTLKNEIDKQMYSVRLFSDPKMKITYDNMIASCKEGEGGVTNEASAIVQNYLSALRVINKDTNNIIPTISSASDLILETNENDMKGFRIKDVDSNSKVDGGEADDVDDDVDDDETDDVDEDKVKVKDKNNFIYFDGEEKKDENEKTELELFTEYYDSKTAEKDKISDQLEATTGQSLEGRKADVARGISALRKGDLGAIGDVISTLVSSFNEFLNSEQGQGIKSLLSFFGRDKNLTELNRHFHLSDDKLAKIRESLGVEEQKLFDELTHKGLKGMFGTLKEEQRQVLITEKNKHPENRIHWNQFLASADTKVDLPTIPTIYDEKLYEPKTTAATTDPLEEDENQKLKEATSTINGITYAYKTESFVSGDDKVDYISSNWEKTEDDKVTNYNLPLFGKIQIIKKDDKFIQITLDDTTDTLKITEDKSTDLSYISKDVGEVSDPNQKKIYLSHHLCQSQEMATLYGSLKDQPTEQKKLLPLIYTLNNLGNEETFDIIKVKTALKSIKDIIATLTKSEKKLYSEYIATLVSKKIIEKPTDSNKASGDEWYREGDWLEVENDGIETGGP